MCILPCKLLFMLSFDIQLMTSSKGALFLLSKWYKKDELGFRTAILSCGGLISNAFGTLIASAILDGMDGKPGHAAWRWY